MLDERNRIQPQSRILASQSAQQLLISHPIFTSSESIACYLAHKNEFDCGAIIEAIWRLGKKCYLPVLSAEGLEFVSYQQDSQLRMNRYQIAEPVDGVRLDASRLDLVIVPLVAFDDECYRLGMGGGYYDRTFAVRDGGKPFLLGVGFEMQRVGSIFRDDWDVRLDGVLTEKEIYLG